MRIKRHIPKFVFGLTLQHTLSNVSMAHEKLRPQKREEGRKKKGACEESVKRERERESGRKYKVRLCKAKECVLLYFYLC